MRIILTALLCATVALQMTVAAAMDTADTPEPAAAKVDPGYIAGKKAITSKDWSGAITALNAAAQRDGKNADIQNLLGYALRNSGNLDLALQHYDKALALNPKHRGAREYLGELYLMQNNLAKAEEQRAALDNLCFLPCEELTDLREKIAAYKKKNPR